MTIEEIIEKRRVLWKKYGDIEYDKRYAAAAAVWILSDRAIAQKVKEKPYLLIEACFSVVNKEKRTVPFFLNGVQRDFIGQFEKYGTAKPFFILKGRQQGFTTLITAMQLSYAIVQRNFAGFTIADRSDNTLSIFNDKARVVYERLPDILKPTERFNSARELFFDKLNSSWRIATATDQVGRSRTLSFVHFSEVAFYECGLSALQAGVGEAITAGAVQVYETTANGFNEAKDLWDGGSCRNLFYEWWKTEEYIESDESYLETNDKWLLDRQKLLYSKGLTRAQVSWYSRKYKGYLDKRLIRQEYPCTPEEAFLSSGDCIFDIDALTNRMAKVSGLQKGRRGRFDYRIKNTPVYGENGDVLALEKEVCDIEFCEDPNGSIFLHEEPRKRMNDITGKTEEEPYAIGGDTAGEGSNYFTAKVISAIDGRTVATYRRQRTDDDLYALQLYCLGKVYHDALIAIETNYSRVPVNTLAEYGYRRIYMREKNDTITRKLLKVYGFATTSSTKPVIIGELVRFMRENPDAEPDMETLREMTTFVRKENGAIEAAVGQNDDLVMALAIAHFAASSGQIAQSWMPQKQKNEDYLERNFNLEETEEADGGILW